MYVDAVYCEICELWLNGPTQWEDHTIRKTQEEPEAPGNGSSEDSGSTQEEGGQDGQGC